MGSGLDLEHGLDPERVFGQGPDLELGWEFDQGSLQDLAQEYDQDMEAGRCQVCRGPLGYGRRSHRVSGRTVSGTLLK